MMERLIVFAFFICALVLSIDAAVDQTLVANAKGSPVVYAVVNKIHKTCIFPDDKQLLRRIAYVESKDGTDPGTYRSGYYGGIWQVDNKGFLDTQKTESHPRLNKYYLDISSEFNIDWKQVRWQDLLKPFYSGLAARLLLANKNPPIPRNVREQAVYWKLHYNTDFGAGTETKFITDVTQLPPGCSIPRADIVFVLDASGSVGATNFNKVREFVYTVVSSLNVGPDNIRIGVIRYSSSVSTILPLGNSSQSETNAAINAMTYTAGGTNTASAIDAARFVFQSNGRPTSSGVPHIAIVVTDGQSNDATQTENAAQQLQSVNVTTFSIGVGSGPTLSELNAIGSDPDCQHVFQLYDFNDFNGFKKELEERTCRVTTIVQKNTPITGELKKYQSQYYAYKMNIDGVTIQLDVGQGSCSVYASYEEENPSAAVNNFKADVRTKRALYIPYREPRVRRRRRAASNVTSATLYTALVGTSAITSKYSLLVVDGDKSASTSYTRMYWMIGTLCALALRV